MRFALIAKDKSGALDVRKANRDAHVAYLKETNVEMAGPFLDENGDMCGSLIILDFEDISGAQNWADNDPYGRAGLFQSVEIIPWNKVIG